MARHVGRGGSASISGTSIGYVRQWSYEESAAEIDITAMQDTEKQYLGGLPDGSGSIDFVFDGDDSGQSEALSLLKAGTQVELTLSTGEKSLTGDTVVVTSYSLGTSYDGTPEGSFGFRGYLEFSGS